MKTTLEITGLKNNVQVTNALAQLLADLQVHYTNLRDLHWNIKGHGFFVLHKEYESMYDDVASKVDEVAERLLQLGVTPEHRFSAYLSQASIKELDVVSCGHKGLEYVLSALSVLIADERKVLAAASDNGDEVTVSLMSDYLAAQEKTVWMLTAFSAQPE
jgi:starvation-inducible DNA-binding protein